MPFAIIAIQPVFVPTQFGTAPIAVQFEQGRKLCKKGANLETTLGTDGITIGFRSDGFTQRAAERAIWLSPNFVSRWMGFLAEREGWTPEEIQKHWASAAELCGPKPTFLVRLVSFPKVDPLAEDQSGGGDPAVTHLSRAVAKWGDQFAPLLGRLIDESQDRDAATVEKPWYTLDPMVSAFAPAGAPEPEDSRGVGDYLASWYFLQASMPVAFGAKEMNLRFIAGSKERIARFRLLK